MSCTRLPCRAIRTPHLYAVVSWEVESLGVQGRKQFTLSFHAVWEDGIGTARQLYITNLAEPCLSAGAALRSLFALNPHSSLRRKRGFYVRFTEAGPQGQIGGSPETLLLRHRSGRPPSVMLLCDLLHVNCVCFFFSLP